MGAHTSAAAKYLARLNKSFPSSLSSSESRRSSSVGGRGTDEVRCCVFGPLWDGRSCFQKRHMLCRRFIDAFRSKCLGADSVRTTVSSISLSTTWRTAGHLIAALRSVVRAKQREVQQVVEILEPGPLGVRSGTSENSFATLRGAGASMEMAERMGSGG